MQLIRTLGQHVGHSENLVAMLVEQQMIVAEMRAADVPMEILGFQIEGKGIRHQRVERAGDVLGGVGAEIGRRHEAR